MVEVGSRGIVNMKGFLKLQVELNIQKRDMSQLLTVLAKIAIVESHKIW